MAAFDPRQCTLYIAVDHVYLQKMLYTYPTWVYCHPELLHMPHMFIYDQDEVSGNDPRWNIIREIHARMATFHRETSAMPLLMTCIPWKLPFQNVSQREEMLTSLVRCAPCITTPWYLKLDADTLGTIRCDSFQARWFDPSYAYIANPWGYTKPAGTIDKLNRWASFVPELAVFPPVKAEKVHLTHQKTKDVHPRMCSWVFIGNTAWTQQAERYCTPESMERFRHDVNDLTMLYPRLPFPSQDTYLAFIQARTNAPWVSVKFRHYGWDHCKNIDKLREACEHALRRDFSLKDLLGDFYDPRQSRTHSAS